MSEGSKSKPIPTRHDEDVVELIEKLSSVTGLGKAEIIRRAVRYTLNKASEEGSLNFLLGNPDEIEDVLRDKKIRPLYSEIDEPQAPKKAPKSSPKK